MRRRRGGDAPVSFFSFQDVLLSLIGITIVVTVILFLQITRTAVLRVADAEKRSAKEEDAAAAIERNELDDRVVLLEAAIRKAQQRPDTDPLAKRTNLRAELLEAGADLETLKRQSEELARQLRELTLLSPDALELRESIELMARRDELVTELGETGRRRRISYIIDTATTAIPVLLEVSADRIVFSELAADSMPQRLSGGTADARIKQALDHYRRTTRGRAAYLLIVLKPSGIDSYWKLRDLVEALPKESRPVLGLDLIPEDSHISEIFPSLEGSRD